MNITTVLKDSYEVSRKNPLVFVPMLASVVVVALLSLITMGSVIGSGMPFIGGMHGEMTGASPNMQRALAGAGIAFGSLLVFSTLSGLVSLLAHGMTVAMANDAVQGQPVTLKTGWDRVVERAVPLVVASVILGLLVGIGLVLLVLPGLLIGFFLMFTLTAVIVDGKDAFSALKTSFQVVRSNFGAVFVLFLVMIALAFLVGIANSILGLIPVLGWLASVVLSSLFGGFLGVFVLQAYLTLRESPETPEAEV